MKDAVEKQPWDQQEDETDKAYSAFCVYLLLGPRRSISAAWRSRTGREEGSYKLAPGYFREWSTRHKWVVRASAHDKHAAHQAIEAREDTLKQLVVKAEQTALVALEQIHDRLQPPEDSIPPELRDIATALNAVTNAIQRLRPATDQDNSKPVTSVSVRVDLFDTDDKDEVGDAS